MVAVINPAGERLILRNVDWESYEQFLKEHQDSSVPRFTYDRGELEIMSPSFEHEELNATVARFVEVVAEELDVHLRTSGSTTFRREDLHRGFEPDSSFYIQSADAIHGKKKINLAIDPPPDLVIEVDVTSDSLDKLPIFGALGISEVWRFDGTDWKILALVNDGYRETQQSACLPIVTASAIKHFTAGIECMRRPEWLRSIREWVRAIQPDDN
jgi:Uma2 family endonuclease